MSESRRSPATGGTKGLAWVAESEELTERVLMSDPYREPTQEPSPEEQKTEKPIFPEAEEKQEKIQEMPGAAPVQEKISPLPPQAVVPQSSGVALKKEDLKDLNEDRQMKILIDLAFEQGIDKAINAAKVIGDAYLIDKFHDTLVDELRQQLIEKGKLKEE